MKVQYHISRANQLSDLSRYEEATKEAFLALGIDPHNEQAYFIILFCWIQLEKYQEAETLGKEALHHHPDSFEIMYLMGVLYNAMDDFVSAKRMLESAIQQNPMSSEAYLELASAHLGFNQIETADRLVKTSLYLDPNNKNALALKSVLEKHSRKYTNAEAEERIDKALELAPESSQTHYLKASLLWSNNEYTKARNHFQTAVQLDPQNEVARVRWLESQVRQVPIVRELLHLFEGGSYNLMRPLILLGVATLASNLVVYNNTLASSNYILFWKIGLLLLIIPAIAFWVIRPYLKILFLKQKFNQTTLEVANPSLPIDLLAWSALFSTIMYGYTNMGVYFGSWGFSLLAGFILIQERMQEEVYPIFKKPFLATLMVLAIVIAVSALFGWAYTLEQEL